MNVDLPLINSHNSWSPLEEVWLGDVYPAGWYDHLSPEVRDIFYQLTENTKEDLTAIEKKLVSMSVSVRRPIYNSIDEYIINDNLVKPEICPRDRYCVIGNKLYRPWQNPNCWQSAIDDYLKDPSSGIVTGTSNVLNGANIVRVGRDLIIDKDCFDYEYRGEFPDYRVRVVSNGGHMDGCFAILKPGLIIANHYWDDYANTFPGWDIIMLDNPTYQAAPYTGFKQDYPVYNGKFWDTTIGTNRSFNDHIIKHALDWVGCYTETYFELNCLVVDTKNVIMLSENQQLADELDKRGITVHWVPFRSRSFWDGAMHCLTVDIRRRSTIEDFFPERE